MVFAFHVFRKSSPNGKLSLLVDRRDYIDHLTHVDPVDGVVLVDCEYVGEWQVYVQVVLTYRYGREENEVMGLTFARELVVASTVVFPEPDGQPQVPTTRLQERLRRKLGPHAFPFHLELPTDAPASVNLQQSPEETGRPCGAVWELRAFVGEASDVQPHRRSCVRLGIRRLQYAPAKPGRQPVATASKEFFLSPGKILMQVTLDKQNYHHGDAVQVTITINNHSNKHVRRIIASLVQLCDVSLGPAVQIKNSVACVDSQQGCPVTPGSSLTRCIRLTPALKHNLGVSGVAVDGQLKAEDTNLASSTLFTSERTRSAFGLVVAYVVRVKVTMGTFGGDMDVEVPLTLMNPPPDTQPAQEHRNGLANGTQFASIDEETRLVFQESARDTGLESQATISSTDDAGAIQALADLDIGQDSKGEDCEGKDLLESTLQRQEAPERWLR